MFRFLSTRGRKLAAIGVLAAATLSACFPNPGQGSRDRIVADHNAARQSWGIGPVAVDGQASWRAQFVAERLRSRSGSGGCSLVHTSAGELASWYPGRTAAENVACTPGCGSASSVTPLFMSSPGHRTHILNPGFTRIGVGTACNGAYLFTAVHLTT
jgi:uncharacterized protein YkwD